MESAWEGASRRPASSPFDAIGWEIRDALIGDPESPAFEQRGVEFPEDLVAERHQHRGPRRYLSADAWTGRSARTRSSGIDRPRCRHDRRVGPTRAASSRARTTPRRSNDELTHVLLHQDGGVLDSRDRGSNVGFEEAPRSARPASRLTPLVSTPRESCRSARSSRAEAGSAARSMTRRCFSQVVAVTANGAERVLRAKLRNGGFVEATPDHVVKARRRTARRLAADGPTRWCCACTSIPTGRRSASRLWSRRERVPSMNDGFPDGCRGFRRARIRQAEAALAGWLQADGFVGQYKTAQPLAPRLSSRLEQQRPRLGHGRPRHRSP